MKWKKTRGWRRSIPRIATREQFAAAIAALPGAQARLNRIDPVEDPSYWLWKLLLHLLHEAVEQSNWDRLGRIVSIYAGVYRVGPRSEMFNSMYVSFEEDIKLPTDCEKLRDFWRPFPRELAQDLKATLGVR